MNTYHKIHTIFKRNPEDKFKSLLIGQYSLPEFEYLKNNIWRWDEKIDGTNIRICYYTHPLANGVGIKGKTDKAEIPKFLLSKLKEIFTYKKLNMVFDCREDRADVCLYGEGYGARIQGGGGNYIRDGVDFILFDIKIGNWWLKREDIEIIAKSLNIKTVPIKGYGTLEEAIKLVKEGFNSYFGNFKVEGLVLRPQVELIARNGQRIITKIKHKDFKNE